MWKCEGVMPVIAFIEYLCTLIKTCHDVKGKQENEDTMHPFVIL